MEWFSEAEKLPMIAEDVLLASPRQFDDFWDLRVMCILVRYEGVVPAPVPKGTKWPVDYYWGSGSNVRDTRLISGNAWWARLDKITLPPGAVHDWGRRGDHFLRQKDFVWVGQTPRNPAPDVLE